MITSNTPTTCWSKDYCQRVITLYNVCSVHRGMFNTSGGVQYIEGYHEYIGGIHEYIGRYHDACGGYDEYIGGCSVHIPPMY